MRTNPALSATRAVRDVRDEYESRGLTRLAAAMHEYPVNPLESAIIAANADAAMQAGEIVSERLLDGAVALRLAEGGGDAK